MEKVFEIFKQGGEILIINVETEETFRGHLMMTFIATATLKMMSDKLGNTSLTTETMFTNLHEQHVIVYDKEFITIEPVKKWMKHIKLSMCNARQLYQVRCKM